MVSLNYQKICQKVLESLSPRQTEVIIRRFGLEGKPRETLQKIGDDFGITRERVRQIELESFKKLQDQKERSEVKNIFDEFKQYLKKHGGVKRENLLLKDLGKNGYQNYVYFFLTLGDSFYRFPETLEFYPFWSLDQNLFSKVQEIVRNLVKKFETEKKPLSQEDLLKWALQEYKEDLQLFFSSLEIAKEVEKGPFGEFGLVSWPEINPRGVRDRAYLVLKQKREPLHFREIAKLASQLPSGCFSSREVLPQTVHNELIRDERFVLVGRGIYGLREWGYIPGTVKEIIANILKEAERPMAKEEILQAVQNQRLVKENTILLNLADKNYFQRDDEGRYILKSV